MGNNTDLVNVLMADVVEYKLKTSRRYDSIIRLDNSADVLASIYNGLGSELYMSDEVRALGDHIFEVFLPAVLLHDVAYSGSRKSSNIFDKANDDFYDNMIVLIKRKVSWWRFIQRYSLRASAKIMYELVSSKLGRKSFLHG